MGNARGTRFFVLLFVALAALSATATAQNWQGMMRDSPYTRFNDKDNEIFMEQNDKTLNEAPDNQTMSWQNPATKHGGDFTILRTLQKDGNTCKEVRVRTEADGRKGDAVLNWCKIDGKWRLLGSSQM